MKFQFGQALINYFTNKNIKKQINYLLTLKKTLEPVDNPATVIAVLGMDHRGKEYFFKIVFKFLFFLLLGVTMFTDVLFSALTEVALFFAKVSLRLALRARSVDSPAPVGVSGNLLFGFIN